MGFSPKSGSFPRVFPRVFPTVGPSAVVQASLIEGLQPQGNAPEKLDAGTIEFVDVCLGATPRGWGAKGTIFHIFQFQSYDSMIIHESQIKFGGINIQII